MLNRRLIGIWLIVGHFSFCTTTLSPGFFYNNTAEHIYPEKTTTQLGPGRILKMEKSCTYNSILFTFFYHGRHTSAAVVAKEAGITKVGVIDYSSLSVFGGLYYSNCIMVWGEIE